jgi:hypothetical protein
MTETRAPYADDGDLITLATVDVIRSKIVLPPGINGPGISLTDLIARLEALQAENARLRGDIIAAGQAFGLLLTRVAKLEGAEAKDCAGVGLLRSQVDGLIERVGNLEDVIEAMGDED